MSAQPLSDREEQEHREAEDLLSTPDAGPAAVRGGVFRVSGFLTGTLLSVLSAALLFRHLGVVDTGRYVTALSLVAIIAAFSDLGLTALGVREVATLRGEERWLFARDLLGLRLALTLIGGAIVTFVAALAYGAELAAGVALAGIGLLLQTTQDNFFLSLTVQLRFALISAIELGRQVLTTVVIVLLVLAGAELLPFLAVPILVGAVALVPVVRVVRGHRSLIPAFNWRRWRPRLSSLLPYAAAAAASALYFRVSILLVSVLSSGRQLGYFSASYRMIEVLMLVPALLVGSALPIFARAARDDHSRLGYAIGKVNEVALVIGAWVAVSIAVGAELAIHIVGGPKFAPAAPVLAVQGVALGASFVSVVWANALVSLGLFRQILAINVAALVLNGLLVAVLVGADGARGAAIGTACAEIAGALLQAFAVARRRPALRPPLRVVPRVALASALGLAPMALTGLPVIARLAISIALFGSVVLLTRALPPETQAILPNSRLWAKIVGA